ncbi:hypothetical protein HYW17_00725 [Candidatus Uhrbacteria bacterium]|nr:hypothetical protein [Candidatus Uhrbacteria bacterium]
MLNEKLFVRLKKEYDTYESARRDLIGVSNGTLSKAKQAIFALHRDDMSAADALLQEVERTFGNLEKQFKQLPELRYEGAYRAALEEYVEAKLFCEWMRIGKVVELKGMQIDADTYLAGLSDFTGELTRKAVQRATQGRAQEVEKLAEVVRDVVEQLIKFDLTGYLRTKYDQAKQNLRRVEEVIYDMHMRRK